MAKGASARRRARPDHDGVSEQFTLATNALLTRLIINGHLQGLPAFRKVFADLERALKHFARVFGVHGGPPDQKRLMMDVHRLRLLEAAIVGLPIRLDFDPVVARWLLRKLRTVDRRVRLATDDPFLAGQPVEWYEHHIRLKRESKSRAENSRKSEQ